MFHEVLSMNSASLLLFQLANTLQQILYMEYPIFEIPSISYREGSGNHSSTLAWKIPWMEKPGRLQSMGSLRVGHDWATSFSISLSCLGERNGSPLQCCCLENPRDGGACWAAVYGVTQSRTRLKWLSSSREAWSAVVHGVAKSWTRLRDWTELSWLWQHPLLDLKYLIWNSVTSTSFVCSDAS